MQRNLIVAICLAAFEPFCHCRPFVRIYFLRKTWFKTFNESQSKQEIKVVLETFNSRTKQSLQRKSSIALNAMESSDSKVLSLQLKSHPNWVASWMRSFNRFSSSWMYTWNQTVFYQTLKNASALLLNNVYRLATVLAAVVHSTELNSSIKYIFNDAF